MADAELAKLRNSSALVTAYAQMISLTKIKDSPVSWSLKEKREVDAPDFRVRSLFEYDKTLISAFWTEREVTADETDSMERTPAWQK